MELKELKGKIVKATGIPTSKAVFGDISLEDVLRAIQNSKNENTGLKPFIRGQAESQGNYGFVKTIEMWKLGQSLDDQSPKTISFLNQLINS